MNEASADAKLNAMAAVINELVTLHNAIRLEPISGRCRTIADSGGGATSTQQKSADQCPMMKAAGGSRYKEPGIP